jgi:hypothetical protein
MDEVPPVNPDGLVDLITLCQAIRDGTSPEVRSLDPPLSLSDFRARMSARGEALFGTARKDQMLELLHSLLWPTARA